MNRRRAWGAVIAVAVAVAPWMLSRSWELPATVTAHHWTRTWIVFDCVLASGLALTGWLGSRRDRRVMPVGVVSGTLLLVDAWVDVCTSPPGLEFHQAVVDAFFELAGAALCLLVAGRGVASTTTNTGASVDDSARPLRDR
ncbi:hypothetical protein [Kitasatospora sp. MAP5-34]|uniref:hypothetical protein n=1 Tax=Kitasatospora sp. MAP5-34 TaxID=3035102 RepID=UPI00247575F6|nr:hypothetical protein [Kitasatospora sp. MAP5-34]MDH6580235.1 hypothetical protein [Kitasatospora sp. MAP5-34]